MHPSQGLGQAPIPLSLSKGPQGYRVGHNTLILLCFLPCRQPTPKGQQGAMDTSGEAASAARVAPIPRSPRSATGHVLSMTQICSYSFGLRTCGWRLECER